MGLQHVLPYHHDRHSDLLRGFRGEIMALADPYTGQSNPNRSLA